MWNWGRGSSAMSMDIYNPWLLRRLTALFFLLTLGLWAAINSLLFCSTVSDSYLLSIWANERSVQDARTRFAEKGVVPIMNTTTEGEKAAVCMQTSK